MKKTGLINLKKIREKYGLSQEDISKEIGVERYQIADWEQGRSKPNYEQLKLLSNFFSKSINYLSDYQIDKNQNDKEIEEDLKFNEFIENMLAKRFYSGL